MAHQASTQTPYKGLLRLDNTLDTKDSTDSMSCQRGESVYSFVYSKHTCAYVDKAAYSALTKQPN